MSKGIKVLFWVVFFFISITFLFLIDNFRVNSKVPVNLFTDDYSLTSWDDYIVVKGTLIEENDNYYDEINYVNIECSRTSKECIQSYGGLFLGSGDKPFLRIKTQTFPIVRWDKDILIFKDRTTCSETTFTLTRDTKKLVGIRNLIPGRSDDFCKNVKDKVIYNLVSGLDHQLLLEKKYRNGSLNLIFLISLLFVTLFGIYKTLRK